MKRVIIIVFFLLSALVLFAQKDTTSYIHEVRISYGIETFPTLFHSKNLFLGGYTATYIYRVKKWFWAGVNINWQFPTEIQYYYWREYYPDNSFKDFNISRRENFFAIAPEVRFSYTNKKWATLYSALSVGYGIHTGINKKNPMNAFMNDFWYWNITFFGANFHIGKKQNVFVGGEVGVGFKGTLTLHFGYRY